MRWAARSHASRSRAAQPSARSHRLMTQADRHATVAGRLALPASAPAADARLRMALASVRVGAPPRSRGGSRSRRGRRTSRHRARARPKATRREPPRVVAATSCPRRRCTFPPPFQHGAPHVSHQHGAHPTRTRDPVFESFSRRRGIRPTLHATAHTHAHLYTRRRTSPCPRTHTSGPTPPDRHTLCPDRSQGVCLPVGSAAITEGNHEGAPAHSPRRESIKVR